MSIVFMGLQNIKLFHTNMEDAELDSYEGSPLTVQQSTAVKGRAKLRTTSAVIWIKKIVMINNEVLSCF